MTNSFKRAWSLLGLALLLAGCQTPRPHSADPSPDWQVLRLQAYAQANVRFSRALLLSPLPARDGSPETLPVTLQPLILQECPPGEGQTACQPSFGARESSRNRSADSLPDPPTLYYHDGRTREPQPSLRVLTFLWFLPASGSGVPMAYRGYRVWLDEDGRGMIWESFGNHARLRTFYVSEPVEAALRLEGHEVLAGRRYAVEPDVDRHPQVVVARLLSREPVPMGPFVYLQSPGWEVATLLCRCMEARVDEVVDERRYRWVRMKDSSELPLPLQPGQRPTPFELLRLPAP